MDPLSFSVIVSGAEATTAIEYRAVEPRGAALVLAHGAGAGQRHPFMTAFAAGLAARGVDIVTFNFLYAERQRKVPDRTPALEACYRAVIDAVRSRPPFEARALFIGGKSLGGRIATHLAANAPPVGLSGVVLLGYPLHPPGRPADRRDAHLPTIGCPALFVQGERDPFGTPEELRPVVARMSRGTLHVVNGGGHSLDVAKRGPRTQEEVHSNVQDVIATWIAGAPRRAARADVV